MPLSLDARQLFEDADQLPVVQAEPDTRADALAQALRSGEPLALLRPCQLPRLLRLVLKASATATKVAALAALEQPEETGWYLLFLCLGLLLLTLPPVTNKTQLRLRAFALQLYTKPWPPDRLEWLR